eukprot:2698444-Prymnesium_polylepis.1
MRACMWGTEERDVGARPTRRRCEREAGRLVVGDSGLLASEETSVKPGVPLAAICIFRFAALVTRITVW